MTLRISKLLLLIEALFLLVPISFFFITLLPGAFSLMFKFRPLTAPASSVLVFVMGAALLSAVRVMVAFYLDSVSGLRRVHGVWWWLCAAGALISVAGVATAIFKRSVGVSENDFIFVLKLSAAGVLLMIPLSHILLEYFFRRRSGHAA